jgi:hypothetical protein
MPPPRAVGTASAIRASAIACRVLPAARHHDAGHRLSGENEQKPQADTSGPFRRQALTGTDCGRSMLRGACRRLVIMNLADLLLDGDHSDQVFNDAVDAADESDIAAVLGLTAHSDPDVRLAVAWVLPSLTHGDDPTIEMVNAAIELSADPETGVRDWACFALGTQWRAVDTVNLRDALAARLDDSDPETQSEALVGLAYRRDPRALPYVRAALSRPNGKMWRLELIAAGALSDPALHDLVLKHQTGWDDDDAPLPIAGLVKRLTDPAGPGDDVLDGVGELYRRRAHDLPDDDDALTAWRTLDGMIDIAPHRAPEFLEAVASRLVGEAAERELRTNSALAQLAAGHE